MARVNGAGYVVRTTTHRTIRNWWLVKATPHCGGISINNIYFPSKMIGKRVRLKIEVIGEE